MIRLATPDDVQAIAILGEKFHTQAGWDEIAYSIEDCAASLARFMDMGIFLGLVSDNDGIDGMVGGVAAQVYFNSDHVSFEELFWWVDDAAPQMAGIKLLKALEAEAKRRGIETVQMKTLNRLNDDRMPALMERMNYRACERSWIKRL